MSGFGTRLAGTEQIPHQPRGALERTLRPDYPEIEQTNLRFDHPTPNDDVGPDSCCEIPFEPARAQRGPRWAWFRADNAPLGEWLDYVLRRIAPKIRCSGKLARFRTVKSGVNHPPTGGSTVLATTTPYIGVRRDKPACCSE